MLNKFLIFVNLILIKQIQTGDVKLYYCNTKEKIDEVKNIAVNLKRFIGHGKTNKIYFIFKKRIVFVKILSNVQIGSDKSLRFSNLNLIFYEQENNELTLPKSIPTNFKVFGHLFEMKSETVHELYFINQANQSKVNEIFEKAYLLNFDESNERTIGERTKLELINNQFIKKELNNLPNIQYFNLFKFNETFKTIYKYHSTKLNSTSDWTISVVLCIDNNRITETLSTKENVKFFTTFSISQFEISVISINDKLNFVNYELNYNKRFVTFQDKLNISFDFDEFFSCHTSFTNLRQLNGIYFNRNSTMFFIFIKRFYLQIKDELVRNGFNLNDNVYETNSHVLKFEEQEIYPNRIPKWWLTRKWIKTVGNNWTFFCPEENGIYYELETTDQGQLIYNQITEISKSIELRSCNEQTLMIKEHLFCLLQGEYFYMYQLKNRSNYIETFRKGALISSIFDNSSIEWEKNQTVQLIFNYNSNEFVLMTLKHLFVFNYDQFDVNNEKIIYNSTGNNKYLKINNHLFDHLYGTSCKDCNTKKSGLNLFAIFLKFLIAIFIFAILFLILNTVYTAYNKNKDSLTEYSKISSFLSYIRVSDSKEIGNKPSITERNNSDLGLVDSGPSLVEIMKKFTQFKSQVSQTNLSKPKNVSKIYKK